MLRPTTIPTLPTARLELRAPLATDAAQLFEVFANPEVMRFWSTPPMTAVAEAEALIERAQVQVADGSGLRWAVSRQSDQCVLGTISLFHFDDQNERAEIGYILGRASWGQGFAREALAAAVEFAFNVLGVRRLEADTDPRNAASIRLLEHLGFVREGVLRERWVVAGEVSDSLLMGLLKRKWRGGGDKARRAPTA